MSLVAAAALSLLSAWSVNWDVRGLVWGLWISTFYLGLGAILMLAIQSTKKTDQPVKPNAPDLFGISVLGGLYLFFFFGYALGIHQTFQPFEYTHNLNGEPLRVIARLTSEFWFTAGSAFLTGLVPPLLRGTEIEDDQNPLVLLLKFHAAMLVVIILGVMRAPPILMYLILASFLLPMKTYGLIRDKLRAR